MALGQCPLHEKPNKSMSQRPPEYKWIRNIALSAENATR